GGPPVGGRGRDRSAEDRRHKRSDGDDGEAASNEIATSHSVHGYFLSNVRSALKARSKETGTQVLDRPGFQPHALCSRLARRRRHRPSSGGTLASPASNKSLPVVARRARPDPPGSGWRHSAE